MKKIFSAARFCLGCGFLTGCAAYEFGAMSMTHGTTGASLVSENITDLSEGKLYDPGFKDLESRAVVSADKTAILGMWGRKIQLRNREGMVESSLRECLLFRQDGSVYDSQTRYDEGRETSQDPQLSGNWMYAGNGIWRGERIFLNGKRTVRYRLSGGKLLFYFRSLGERGRIFDNYRVFERIE